MLLVAELEIEADGKRFQRPWDVVSRNGKRLRASRNTKIHCEIEATNSRWSIAEIVVTITPEPTRLWARSKRNSGRKISREKLNEDRHASPGVKRNETGEKIRRREERNEVAATTCGTDEEESRRCEKEITSRNYLKRFPVKLLFASRRLIVPRNMLLL